MSERRAIWDQPWALPLLLVVALAIRAAAAVVLAVPPQSDGLAYVTMVQNLVSGEGLADNFGQKAFYSAGYPLALAPVYALLGGGMKAVIAFNLLLALATGALLYSLALRLTARRGAALAAVALWAVWLASVWNATMPAKENLSTPLLLLVLIAALDLVRGTVRPFLTGLVGGLAWGAGVVTGGSSVLSIAAFGVALVFALRERRGMALHAALGLSLGAALTLGSWLIATERMLGAPVLNTNAEFNLYLGNNPAATGGFVSIADTPVGPVWQRRHAQLGELGAARWLGHEARTWIAANPGAAAALAARKLALFWAPNIPDRADFAASRAIATVRLGDVALYIAVVALALTGLFRARLTRADRLVVAALIAGFWVVHAAAYVMPRYRDPLAPVLIALAVAWLWPLCQAKVRRREA